LKNLKYKKYICITNTCVARATLLVFKNPIAKKCLDAPCQTEHSFLGRWIRAGRTDCTRVCQPKISWIRTETHLTRTVSLCRLPSGIGDTVSSPKISPPISLPPSSLRCDPTIHLAPGFLLAAISGGGARRSRSWRGPAISDATRRNFSP
jgi:hypothetical protein